MKYPKQGTLSKYYDDIVIDKVHNMLKHGNIDTLGKYQVYLHPIPKSLYRNHSTY